MKKRITVIFLLLVVLLTNVKSPTIVYALPNSYDLVPYNGEVLHFFTHELVYDTNKAFSISNPIRHSSDKDHLTCQEFWSFLLAMYSNNFILIDIFDMYEKDEQNCWKNKQIFLPKDKKPFTLSFDDMTYDTYDLGCVNKIILNENNEICDYCHNNPIKVSQDRENITLLEKFISIYPSFAFQNARPTICVNGYNGILGYRTQTTNPNYEKERQMAKIVVDKLKSIGYTFANHSYYHDFLNTMPYDKLTRDLKNWKESVECVVGKTEIFCYPGGIHNASDYRNDYLKQNGYTLFLCVGRDYKKKNEYNDNRYVYIYRMPLDGTALRLYKDFYKDTFDTSLIYDHSHRFRNFNYKGTYS